MADEPFLSHFSIRGVATAERSHAARQSGRAAQGWRRRFWFGISGERIEALRRKSDVWDGYVRLGWKGAEERVSGGEEGAINRWSGAQRDPCVGPSSAKLHRPRAQSFDVLSCTSPASTHHTDPDNKPLLLSPALVACASYSYLSLTPGIPLWPPTAFHLATTTQPHLPSTQQPAMASRRKVLLKVRLVAHAKMGRYF